MGDKINAMKKIERLIIKINEMLLALFGHISNLTIALIPKKIKKKLNIAERKSPQRAAPKKVVPKKNLKENFAAISAVASKASKKISGKISPALDKMRKFDIKKVSFKSTFLFLFAILSPLLLRFKSWWLSLKPITVVGIVVTSSVGTLAGISVYSNAKKVAHEALPPEIVEEVDVYQQQFERKSFYKNGERYLLITAVIIPVYIESAASIRTLSVDFTLMMSNRYLQAYFLGHEYLVRNTLSNGLQPIVPEFPLSPEGKSILKDKIKKELNELIEDLGIEGFIENVFFDNIIAA
ncbi:MAG: hypothetical protein A2504_04080 [Bdellovibrionales bacterium RIFOXYD12_FULL_39_22]|nr:MAG: hypothetical protein A2385_11830 [Bdellovibrionales bacterium RIFOXYB1_FULL_39_21]OFZ41751.1 MAG: hypothetical protein A2485_02140 [Bdellovibrionales bacterium RIFOXYC12_FULL_39_17]OFZ46151.1 MAG: hypothetical protein A2404_12505 [Bdellovibrionales bacterium RIFOXYC1_FULL_39_130]OFZ74977.1 MAG: hypothetical protein A2560_15545 [Bdellovibrionales bacterium RIFOXYD1_FULL_39_84]OFZ76250.1 MAG: hypothetical protein A2451_05385 [Bdellovibrionales bacterium RIFOXYC2_FULL_39_8]OFZ92830.1 MAG: